VVRSEVSGTLEIEQLIPHVDLVIGAYVVRLATEGAPRSP
jgi:hypothetical protein